MILDNPWLDRQQKALEQGINLGQIAQRQNLLAPLYQAQAQEGFMRIAEHIRNLKQQEGMRNALAGLSGEDWKDPKKIGQALMPYDPQSAIPLLTAGMKDKHWVYNPQEGTKQQVSTPELQDYLSKGWKIGEPTGSAQWVKPTLPGPVEEYLSLYSGEDLTSKEGFTRALAGLRANPKAYERWFLQRTLTTRKPEKPEVSPARALFRLPAIDRAIALLKGSDTFTPEMQAVASILGYSGLANQVGKKMDPEAKQVYLDDLQNERNYYQQFLPEKYRKPTAPGVASAPGALGPPRAVEGRTPWRPSTTYQVTATNPETHERMGWDGTKWVLIK
jgi:hypothetical protein